MLKISNKANEADPNGLQDFSKIRAAQIDCVLRTITETIDKIKMSIVLPRILERERELDKLVKNTPYAKAIPMVKKFIARRDRLIRNKTRLLLDRKLIRMIDFFQENYKIYELFSQSSYALDCEERKLLQAFDMLYDIAKYHLYRSAKVGLSRERELHRIYHETKELNSNIFEIKELLKKKNLKKRWRLAAKKVLLKKTEEDLAAKQWQNKRRVENEIVKCARDVRSSHKASMEKQKQLEEELETVKQEYSKIAKSNVAQEQEACGEKNKLLMQLQGLLKKYDQTIGEKMRENLAIQEEYAEVKRRIDNYMKIYHREEAIYAELVLKREEKERRELKRQIILFMMNRAARKIQRYWRAWRKSQKKQRKKVMAKKA